MIKDNYKRKIFSTSICARDYLNVKFSIFDENENNEEIEDDISVVDELNDLHVELEKEFSNSAKTDMRSTF